MKNILVLFTALIFVSGSAVFVSGATSEFRGYIADNLCSGKAKSADGFNLKIEPQKHTTACLRMKPCVSSGFGIWIKRKPSDASYTFYKFDSRGNKKALELLYRTEKTDNLLVVVKGTLSGKVLSVVSIEEVK